MLAIRIRKFIKEIGLPLPANSLQPLEWKCMLEDIELHLETPVQSADVPLWSGLSDGKPRRTEDFCGALHICYSSFLRVAH